MFLTLCIRGYLLVQAAAQALRRALAAQGRLVAHTGKGSVEWVLITAGLALGVASALAVLTGAINDYFTAIADWLRSHRPI